MGKASIILIAIVLFVIITFLYWKITRGFGEKEYGKKMWENWGTRTFYWTGALFISGGITVLLIYLLKWGNVLAF
ncbi:hypothetical protein MBM09_11785 [Flaviramulus sp. BrNp1-15]|uniref:hypothetical protein n=1 Tax=Flaviramulus sp. BrNp1-15 TaxID=2916754 RepID=UPI001EE7EACD|nr:hypothetical protein [Flaviramulus sp. BrNp1-15]ULC58599.1 hypothetical protein MBM09_11785 [Flaviramulus sp. BrNp1-15]